MKNTTQANNKLQGKTPAAAAQSSSYFVTSEVDGFFTCTPLLIIFHVSVSASEMGAARTVSLIISLTNRGLARIYATGKSQRFVSPLLGRMNIHPFLGFGGKVTCFVTEGICNRSVASLPVHSPLAWCLS
jgi:hypothetical protein